MRCGQVAQSASAGFMYPWCACLTGSAAGVMYVFLRFIVVTALKIDDVTDAFAGAPSDRAGSFVKCCLLVMGAR